MQSIRSTILTFQTLILYSDIRILLKHIDETDGSILSNTCNIRLRKATTIKTGQETGYTSVFGNALYNPNDGYNAAGGGITQTTGFYTQGDAVNIHYFDDDGKGNLRRFYLSSGAKSLFG